MIHEPSPRSAYTRRSLELRAADYYTSIRKPQSERRTVEDLAPQLAEFEHRIRVEDYDQAYTVLRYIDYNHLFIWGYYPRLLAMHEQLFGRLKTPEAQAGNLSSLGRIWGSLRQFEKSVAFEEKALKIYRELQDRQGEQRSLGALGLAYRRLGQIEYGIECHQQSLDLARKLGLRHAEGFQLGNLGNAYCSLKQFEQATQLQLAALTIMRETGDPKAEGAWLAQFAITYQAQKEFQTAVTLYQQALEIASQYNCYDIKLRCLKGMASICWELSQFDQAIALLNQALDIAQQVDDQPQAAELKSNLEFCRQRLQLSQVQSTPDNTLLVTVISQEETL